MSVEATSKGSFTYEVRVLALMAKNQFNETKRNVDQRLDSDKIPDWVKLGCGTLGIAALGALGYALFGDVAKVK